MNELIKIKEYNGKQAVSARELHEFLESKQDFSNWIRNRIKKYGLVENQDYTSLNKIVERETGGTTRIEYALSISAAKELAMVEGNAKGKQARQYFITCENKLREIASKPLSQVEIVAKSAQILLEQSQRINEIENKVLEIEARTTTRPDYFTIMGYATLHHIRVGLHLAAKLGMRATRLCNELNYPMEEIPDPRFGRVKMYPTKILNRVFNEVVVSSATMF